ncbi:MAG: DNA-processing protein DprA [Microgenomates group bacterium]|jgi:DNA processing protein|nr:DNA-processing protein DprA [Candidatus Woesebacteria bacterium]MBP6883200.1 DNA-processing protein DprA [Candidatus Woesebacteria bacterium]QQR63945.1 MAG: DNA-protecting protein DprA [Candidatus Roizmanbacteria bacterium]
MDTSLPYYLGFSHFLGIGPIKFNALLSKYEIEEAYNLSEDVLAGIVGAQTSRKFVQFRKDFDPQKKQEEFAHRKIEVVSRKDSRYPNQLKELSDAPICLYVKGDSRLFTDERQFHFAVVGTRKASPYGLKITREIVQDLCGRNSNICIVSGLAYGVDAVAHETTLEFGANTIAFLGCGVNIMYPYGNRHIYDKIISGGGVVVSEFPPDQTVVPGLFIARNRLISGLSRGVLIVEGTKTSGALITARYAAEQGKDVFALPGQINTTLSEAPNILIKEGAIIVTSTNDIADYYAFGQKVLKSERSELKLSVDELAVYSYLEKNPRLIDEVVQELQYPAQHIMTLLSRLELEGVVVRRSDEKYYVK